MVERGELTSFAGDGEVVNYLKNGLGVVIAAQYLGSSGISGLKRTNAIVNFMTTKVFL